MTLRVLHVETGRHLYGGALQVYYLMRGLKERGCRNILVCPQASEIGAASAAIAEVRALPMRGDIDVRFIARLRATIRAMQPDIVHLHSRRGADILGGIAARLEHVPVVMTRRVASPEPRFLARFKYRLYDRVVAISNGVRDALVTAGVPATKIERVYSAVDSNQFKPGCQHAEFGASFGVEPGTRTIGMVARFIESKGHRYLLDAVPQILAAIPKARFLLFGRGPLEPSMRARIETMGLKAQVRIEGFRDDIERVLPCLDLVVHPAEVEGLGVALLQAAACGVPIVATRAGGIPDVVRDGVNGILLPPKDTAALARAVIELLRDPERAQALGAAGRDLIEREFSIDAMVESYLRVYQRMRARNH